MFFGGYRKVTPGCNGPRVSSSYKEMVKKVRRSDSFLQCNPADSHIIIYFHLRIFYTTIPFHIKQQRTFPIAPKIKFCILQKSAAVICKISKGKNRSNTRLGHCSKHVKKSLYSLFPRT